MINAIVLYVPHVKIKKGGHVTPPGGAAQALSSPQGLTAWPLTRRLGLSQGGRASDKKAGSLKRRPGLSQGGRASHREARPLTGRPSLSQGGRALKGRLGL